MTRGDIPAGLLDPEHGPRPGPVLLQLVVVALRRREHVHDHGPVVDQHPVGRRRPLAPDRLDALVAQALDDPVGDGRDLPLRTARADHEGVGERRELAEVEQHDVGGLLVLRELDDPSGEVERGAIGRHGAVAGRQAVRARVGGGGGIGHVVWVLQAGSMYSECRAM